MKTKQVGALVRLGGLIVALALLGGTAPELMAQQGQGAMTLMRLSSQLKAPSATRSNSQAMSCAKCKDRIVAAPDTDPKGLGARVLTGRNINFVTRHECENCSTDWVVTGTGKAKTAVGIHECAANGLGKLACGIIADKFSKR